MSKFTPRQRRQPEQTYKVNKNCQLLPYLIELWPERSRTTIKSYLNHRQISINGKTTTAFDTALHIGDLLTLRPVGERRPNPNQKIRIVFEDNHLIIIDKKQGLLSMPTPGGNDISALSILSEHVRHFHRDNCVYIVNPVDRDTSGLMMFAKTEELQKILQNNLSDNVIQQTYVAVIEGVPTLKESKIESWLTESPTSIRMEVSATDNGGKRAITNYKVVKDNGLYSLVELRTETRIKQQMRVQLASIGHPIAGDKRYGASSNPLGRLCLHLRTLKFTHPATGERMIFDTDIPTSFK